MVCEFCDGQVEPQVILTSFHYMGKTIYVDGVPARVCRQCGERYFDGAVYERLEAIAKRSGRIKEAIQFPLAHYGAPKRRPKPTRRIPERTSLSRSREPGAARVAP
jgi:YgiT-type zinc finger domain-containing protein